MKKLLIIVLLLLTVIMFTACDAKVQSDAKDFVGKNYTDVISELNELGFKNIKETPIEDLTSEGPMEDGYVETVVIDGNGSFKAGDSFSTDSNVTVTYHIIKKVKPPIASDQIQTKHFRTLSSMFSEQGYINVMTDEVYDLDPDTTKEKHINEIIINDTNEFSTEDEFPFDANVLVVCHYPYSKYDANVKVDFIGNLFLNKYDVNFLIDGKKEKTLPHGEDMDETFNLPEGDHVFSFENVEDSNIKGDAKIDVTSDLEVAYEIICYGDKVSVEEKYIDRKIELSADQLKMTCSESDFTGKNYKKVVKLLKKEGFENIQLKPIYDLYDTWFEPEKGETKSVKIDGSRDYRRGDIFNKNAKVMVRYHLLKDDDPEIKAAEEAARKEHDELISSIVGKSCVDVKKYVKEKGYTARYTSEVTGDDFTEFMSYTPDSDIKKCGFIVTDIKEYDTDNKTISLIINTKENIERTKKEEELREKLESNFSVGDAIVAMKKHGEKQYPYGFKMHELGGMLAQTPIDEHTWFLKYYVDTTNEYGAKAKNQNCEAKVTNKNGSVKVYDFHVY